MVIHEAWGLNDDIARIADRFAANGYLAVAPDLIGGGLRCVVRTFREMTRGEGPSVDRASATLGWMKDRPDTAEGGCGVVGFCMGGGFALLLGADARVGAIAPNYGFVPSDDRLGELCPVVASYGEKDRSFAKQARRLEMALETNGIAHDVKIYPGVGHSFLNDGAPWLVNLIGRIGSLGYDEEAAEDAWDRILTFFAEHLSPGTAQ